MVIYRTLGIGENLQYQQDLSVLISSPSHYFRRTYAYVSNHMTHKDTGLHTISEAANHQYKRFHEHITNIH